MPQVMGPNLVVSVKDECSNVKGVVGMGGGWLVVGDDCVGGKGWWRALCWVSSLRELKEHVGAVGQDCRVQE